MLIEDNGRGVFSRASFLANPVPWNRPERQIVSRRNFLKQTALVAGVVLPPGVHAVKPQLQAPLADSDDKFLDELERANYLYFWEQANPQTGLVKDRCNVRGNDTRRRGQYRRNRIRTDRAMHRGDIAAISPTRRRGDRVLATLRFLWKKLPHHRGFFYHFADVNTGERHWDSEISSVDTAILLCGVLTCRQHLPSRGDHRPGSRDLQPRGLDVALGRHHAAAARMDAGSRLSALSVGRLQRTDDDVPAGSRISLTSVAGRSLGCLEANSRSNTTGLRYIGSFAPLFVHQYSQAWFDFRGKRDNYADYFRNSTIATDVHRALLPGTRQTVSRLQRRSVGHHGFRFAAWLRGLGRTSGSGTDRRNRCAQRRRRIAAVSAAGMLARAART